MALTLMSCSLLPHTTNAVSVQLTNQLEVNTDIKELKKESKQKQTAETSISGLIEIIEQKYIYQVDNSPEAKAAIQELAKIGKPAVPELINALRKNRILLTFGVAETLSKIAHKDSSVVPILINKLGDENSQVRFGAMKALENDSSVPELKKAAQDKNPRIAAGAIFALGRAYQNSIVLPFLDNKNLLIRRSAALGLAPSSRKKTLEVFTILKNALDDEDAFIRVNSALNLTFAIGYIKEVSQVIEIDDINKIAKVMVEGAENKDSSIRFTAVQAFSQIYRIRYLYEITPNPPLVPSIIKAIKDEDPGVRYMAIWVIAKMENAKKAAIPLLIKELDSKDERLRGVAAFAFKGMGSDAKPAIPKIIAISQNKQENEQNRRYALRTLGNLKKNAVLAIPALINTIEDKQNSELIIIGAAQALQKIDSVVLIPYLVKNISGKDKKFSAAWLRILKSTVNGIKRDKNDLSQAELSKTISELETALKIIENSKNDFPQHIAPFLRESIVELKK